jgi:N-acetylmuramoyl-L-alanine amidase
MSRRARSGGSRGGKRAAGGTRAIGGPHRHQPWKIPVLAALAVLFVVVGAAFALGQLSPSIQAPRLTGTDDGPLPSSSIATSDGVSTTSTAEAAVSLVPSGTVEVEVPDVVGKAMTTAEALLQAAGFVTVTRVAGQARPGVAGDVVLAQDPPSGTRLNTGDTVTITYNPRSGTALGTVQPVVVIDAGHQEKADVTLEPIGPGSATKKEKVKGGATGVATGIPEYKQVLAISMRLRDKLAAAGIRVVMIRTTNDVNIANSQRAAIGNDAGAALVVRVHCDSNANTSVRGLSTLYPSGNTWVKAIEAASKRAAGLVQAATVKATGAKDRGLFPRADMSGFNYSKVPTIIVECAFMSNAEEDRLLATPAYQDKLAAGMSIGVLEYLGR